MSGRRQCRGRGDSRSDDGASAATLRDEGSSESEPLTVVAWVRTECPPVCVERARGAYRCENSWNRVGVVPSFLYSKTPNVRHRKQYQMQLFGYGNN